MSKLERRIKMTNKFKLEVIERTIYFTRSELRSIYRKLENLTRHKEYKDLCSKEELKQLEEIEDLLLELEYRLNDKLTDM